MRFLLLSFNEEQYKELLNRIENLEDKGFSSQKEEILAFISDTMGDKKLSRQLSKLKYVENAVARIKARTKYLRDINLKITSNEIQVNKQLYVNSVRLILDKETCFRCEISHSICPKDAITIERGERGSEPVIQVDHDKCVLCGLCVPFCPSGCLSLFVDDEADLLLADYQSLPILPELEETNICQKCVRACEKDAIDFNMQPEIIDDAYGTITVATGYETYPIENIGEYGYGTIPDVISGLQFERLLSSNGPTGGEIRRPSDGKLVKTIVFVHCAGSRDPAKHLPHCSKICCMYSTKHALQFKHLVHDGMAYNFYIDVRTAGKDYEEFYQRATEQERVVFVRGKISELQEDGDKILVRGVNTLTAETVEIHADMVVLATGLIPSDGTKEIAQLLKLSSGPAGFIKEAHAKLKPVETALSGIYVAGTAAGPKDIPEVVASASGSSSKALGLLSSDFLERDPIIAVVDETTCGICMTCTYICPYGAISLNRNTGKIEVNDALCEGCGSCAAGCPSGSIELRNSTYGAISNSIKALLSEVR